MQLQTENVILVDSNDIEIGQMEKIEAHQKALLHRAFSVFIFNNKSQILLQKRNVDKYHSGGLWTNTCCGHPRPGESIDIAANRRLFEEMGFNTKLQKKFVFTYKADLENGIFENEIDHVFYGNFNSYPEPNPLEVSEWKFEDWATVIHDVRKNPQKYTVWFRICIEKIDVKN